jgi:hypothetical protein
MDKDKDTIAKHDRVELLAGADTSGGGLCECESVWCICDTDQSYAILECGYVQF